MSFDRDFDKSFKRMRRIVFTIFGVVLTVIIGFWLIVGYAAVKVVQDPKGVASGAGEIVGAFVDGTKK